jgi:hypothetical protein
MAKVYDFKKVDWVFGGHRAQGFANGTGISVERAEDSFTMETGNDGETTRSKTNNFAATVTITLKKSSSSNDIFSAFLAADELEGLGVREASLIERGATTKMVGKGWIKRLPNFGYGKSAEDVQWQFDLDSFTGVLGGNLEL